MTLELRFYPDPIFRKIAEPVEIFDEYILLIEKGFKDALQQYNALGLGANMLGLLKRVIIASDGDNEPIFMVNPLITKKSDQLLKGEEASLSIPGIILQIERHQNIEVCYQNPVGEMKTIFAEGLFARVIQHEIDYLDGITIFDKLTTTKRILTAQKYYKLRKKQPFNI